MRAPVPPSSTLLHCRPACSMPSWKLERCPLVGGAAKIREAFQSARMQNKPFYGQAEGVEGYWKSYNWTANLEVWQLFTQGIHLRCAAAPAGGPGHLQTLVKPDIKGLSGVLSCTCSIPGVWSCPKHHPGSRCHLSCAVRAGGAGGTHTVPAGRAAVGTPGSSANQQEHLAASTRPRPGQEL